ncbi:hypothetical protein [Alishewanella tabrizica]|uniref:Uncharacterized protein n=1 Tax=Alishewanella tabrizica TaxID=671278 RepID=A0ABQ2WTB7_9ALTE|nr:hypothetical protein [Alishewanella tabrizica]GGW73634.1 hypothetical protein GCM10008111_31930 [Alishewanella tabrizica]
MLLSNENFRDAVLLEFGFLENDFRLKNTSSEHESEQFMVCYKSATVQVIVEGINWGENARVAVGSCIGFQNFDLYDLVKAKTGEYPTQSIASFSQIAQLPLLAMLLKEHGEQVLNGDFTIFPSITEIVKARVASFDDGIERIVI